MATGLPKGSVVYRYSQGICTLVLVRKTKVDRCFCFCFYSFLNLFYAVKKAVKMIFRYCKVHICLSLRTRIGRTFLKVLIYGRGNKAVVIMKRQYAFWLVGKIKRFAA